MAEQPETIEAEYDEYYDRASDRNSLVPTPPSLIHLTLSDTALTFFEKYPVLHDFKSLVDQLVATNHFDDRQAEYYKRMIDELVIDLHIAGYGDTGEEAKVLNIARSYMYQIVDGAKGGYRGRLATEIRRTSTYTHQSDSQPKKKGWWPF